MTSLLTVIDETPAVPSALPDCSLCSDPSRACFVRHGFQIHECRSCGHRFTQPAKESSHVGSVYDDDYFFGGGAGYRNYLDEGALLRAHGRRYGKLLKKHGADGRLLDVGAAAGFILQGLCDTGFDGEGIEPNASMVRHARDQLKLDVNADSLESFEGSSRFDVVTMIQVVGHFIDPMASVNKVAVLLQSGGLCLVETWDVASWPARLFGANWHEYSPPSVLQWFSKRSLHRLFADCGFEVVRSGHPSKWINAAHATSLIRHKLSDSRLATLVKKGLNCVPGSLNLPYPADDVFWTLFRRVEL